MKQFIRAVRYRILCHRLQSHCDHLATLIVSASYCERRIFALRQKLYAFQSEDSRD